MQNSKETVRAFYEECLTVGGTADLTARLAQLLANDFESRNAASTKNKEALIGQINGFWKLMPDMRWEIQDMVQEGDRVVVRSLFSGSPRGNFMGMELDGTKTFKTMAMDMHTVENGQIKTVYHVEEWSTAIAQLKG
jgi:predicted ester cyclase